MLSNLVVYCVRICFLSRHAAASYGQTEIIDFLVKEAGAIVDIRDTDGDTPLLFVEKPEVFELLVSLGADITVRNSNGEGLVDKVVDDENEEMVEFLINRGIIGDTSLIEKLRVQFANGGMEEFNGEYNMDEDEEEEGEEEGEGDNTADNEDGDS